MRSKKSVFAAMGLVFLITVPWLFTETREEDLFGFPLWAAWTVISTIGASFYVAFCLGRYWEVSSGDRGEESRAQNGRPRQEPRS